MATSSAAQTPNPSDSVRTQINEEFSSFLRRIEQIRSQNSEPLLEKLQMNERKVMGFKIEVQLDCEHI